jgi:polar amino acid transport system permease protein
MSEPPGAAVSVAEAPPPADTPSKELAAQRVLPLRRPGRWIATAVVLVLAAQFVHGLVSNPFYQWDRFGYWFFRPTILDGLLVTLEVTVYSAVLGLLGGILLALARLSSSPVLRAVSWVYIWALRSIPLIVVLLFLYNFSALYKTLSLGVPFGPAFFTFDESRLATDMVVAVIGLSLNEAAYAAEVPQDRLPAGPALHHPQLRQPADRPGQEHLARLLRLPARPVRHGADHGRHLPR